jgi:RNA polymerase sigma factor (TIGR02999 family)
MSGSARGLLVQDERGKPSETKKFKRLSPCESVTASALDGMSDALSAGFELWRPVRPINSDGMSDVTSLLDAAAAGDRRAAAELLPLVYDELRMLAAARMAAESPDHTLQATALVHEAYLRLVGPADAVRWDGRGHFFAAAAEAMRRILVDAARRKRREKHGGDWGRVGLDEAQPAAPDPRHDLVALDEALTRLAAEDPQAARLVELRHFAGLSVPEAARALGVSPRTADRLWAFARAWLHRELTGGAGDPGS